MRTAGALLLLITLLCSGGKSVSAVKDEQLDVRQLAGTVKLLQLQLKQTVETVDHISALLSGAERQTSSPLTSNELSSKAASQNADAETPNVGKVQDASASSCKVGSR